MSDSIVKDICESYEKGFGNGIKGNGIFPDHIIAGASYHSLHYAERLGYDAGYAKHQRHEAAKGDDWLDTGKACC